MNSAERRRAFAQVERAVQALVKKGWRCEKIDTSDEDGEPYRVFVSLRIEALDLEPRKGVW